MFDSSNRQNRLSKLGALKGFQRCCICTHRACTATGVGMSERAVADDSYRTVHQAPQCRRCHWEAFLMWKSELQMLWDGQGSSTLCTEPETTDNTISDLTPVTASAPLCDSLTQISCRCLLCRGHASPHILAVSPGPRGLNSYRWLRNSHKPQSDAILHLGHSRIDTVQVWLGSQFPSYQIHLSYCLLLHLALRHESWTLYSRLSANF